MTTFTASNGIQIESHGNGGLISKWPTTRYNLLISGGDAEALREFFLREREAKPWHDAEPGEVWVLTVDGSEEFPCSVSPSGPDFEPIAHPVWATIARGSDRITSARRIWPEVES